VVEFFAVMSILAGKSFVPVISDADISELIEFTTGFAPMWEGAGDTCEELLKAAKANGECKSLLLEQFGTGLSMSLQNKMDVAFSLLGTESGKRSAEYLMLAVFNEVFFMGVPIIDGNEILMLEVKSSA
jgi:hypothetical protein